MSHDQDDVVVQVGHGEILISAINSILRYHDSYQSGEYGKLLVTNYRIVFVTELELPPISPRHKVNHPDIPLTSVRQLYGSLRTPGSNSVFSRSRIPLTGGVKVAHLDFLEILCKNFEVYRFGVQHTDKNALKKLITTLLHHCFPSSQPCLFAFDYHPAIENAETNGGSYINGDVRQRRQNTLESELRRCKADIDGWWTIAQNLQFAICDTYPALVIIPSAVSDEVLVQCKHLWTDGRFPIWSWSHQLSKNWLVRSSPKTVQNGDDISAAFIKALDDIGGTTTETISAANLSSLQVQASFEKLLDLCYHDRPDEITLDSESSWLGLFDDTKWGRLVALALDKATNGASKMMVGANIIIEGNCPGNAECLVTSLIMVMLDPFFRTQSGLQLLIEKEWCSTGFRFLDSHLVQRNRGSKGYNSIFLLFLDCLHQLTKQFPLSFEFTEAYLIHLWNTVLSCLYGDFIFNNDKERTPPDYNNTPSFWQHDRHFDPTDITDAVHKNVAYEKNPGPVLPKYLGMYVRPWILCFYPTMAQIIAAEEQIFRQLYVEKLVKREILIEKKAALMKELGIDDKTEPVQDGRPAVTQDQILAITSV